MAKRVILTVDDEPLIVRLVQVNLLKAGYTVLTASDGLEAMQLLRKADPLPDLILLDGIMPYMDGFETLMQIKTDEKLKAIPVVMLSARSRDADILEAEQRGAVCYLPKPVNPTDLLNTIQEQIGPAEYA